MPNLFSFVRTYLKAKPQATASVILVARIAGLLPFIFLLGCSSAPTSIADQQTATDPSTGGLLQTAQALKTGAYEQYLQAKRTELRHWQSAQIKQHSAIIGLKEHRTRLEREKASLAKTANSHAHHTQTSQERIQALNQQRTELVNETQNLQAAAQQLDQTLKTQTQQRVEKQQRISALLAERERLRQALKLMINSDGSLTEEF